MHFFSRALFLAEKLKDQKSIAIASLEIGNNIRLGNISNRPFESYFQRAIELFEILEDPLSQSYLQYAKVLLEADDNKKVAYSEKAIELLEPSISKSDTLLMESLARHYNVVVVSNDGVALQTIFNGNLEANEVKEVTYDTYELPSGVYIVRMATAAGVRNLKLMVKR